MTIDSGDASTFVPAPSSWPSLVAMSTHGRTGLARVALGSVATAVVRASLCPVLVNRPPLLTAQGTSAPLTRNHGAGAPVPGVASSSTG